MNRLVPAALLLAVACATTSRSAGPPASQTVLTREQIRGVNVQNAYEVVQQLRPAWLKRRGTYSLRDPAAGAVVVYLNGIRAGLVEELQRIPVEELAEIRFLSGPEATMRYGLNNVGGVIEVVTGVPR